MIASLFIRLSSSDFPVAELPKRKQKLEGICRGLLWRDSYSDVSVMIGYAGDISHALSIALASSLMSLECWYELRHLSNRKRRRFESTSSSYERSARPLRNFRQSCDVLNVLFIILVEMELSPDTLCFITKSLVSLEVVKNYRVVWASACALFISRVPSPSLWLPALSFRGPCIFENERCELLPQDLLLRLLLPIEELVFSRELLRMAFDANLLARPP